MFRDRSPYRGSSSGGGSGGGGGGNGEEQKSRHMKEGIRDLEVFFAKCGPLITVWVARSPPGFAFIEFENERDAIDACHTHDGRSIHGNSVKVEMSTGRGKLGDSGRGGGGGRDGGGGRGGPACYTCGDVGHFARSCTKDRDDRGNGDGAREVDRGGSRRRSHSASPPAHGFRSDKPPFASHQSSPPRGRSPVALTPRRRDHSPASRLPPRVRSPPLSRTRSPPLSRARSPPASRARSPPSSRTMSPPSRARSPPPSRTVSPSSRARSPPPRVRSPVRDTLSSRVTSATKSDRTK